MKIAAAMLADAGVVEFVVREQLPEPLERQACDVRRTQFLVTGDHVLERAFKVPSLRGVSERAPHMHAGQFDTLTEVVDHYNRAPKVV